MVEFLPWLQLRRGSVNPDDPVTSQLQLLRISSAGALRQLDGATTSFVPLLATTPNSMLFPEAVIRGRPAPTELLESFVPSGDVKVLAARIAGPVRTAFPDGPPPSEDAPGSAAASAGTPRQLEGAAQRHHRRGYRHARRQPRRERARRPRHQQCRSRHECAGEPHGRRGSEPAPRARAVVPALHPHRGHGESRAQPLPGDRAAGREGAGGDAGAARRHARRGAARPGRAVGRPAAGARHDRAVERSHPGAAPAAARRPGGFPARHRPAAAMADGRQYRADAGLRGACRNRSGRVAAVPPRCAWRVQASRGCRSERRSLEA